MFTGIIEATAGVIGNEGARLTLERPSAYDDLMTGQSIAVHGVCLTAVSFDEESMAFDVADTTRKRTTLGSLAPGDRVHLERALSASGRLDGHMVQGHVDDVAIVVSVEKGEGESRLRIRLPRDLLPYVVPRGSITVDGVSLTVADITDDVVTIALVPHTISMTTLGMHGAGDRVNIETDLVGRYIVSLASHGR